eukprot:TRINITY_DN3732_c0_g1_i2.p1 TRINITY_DN3732_c0_g1~~TRINITY_DN3732_c0_g1_i2.p1  ORF type:complete len:151 (+),score=3.75 TRINITY_DN3732_c0_g1_i2:618-1070(+)
MHALQQNHMCLQLVSACSILRQQLATADPMHGDTYEKFNFKSQLSRQQQAFFHCIFLIHCSAPCLHVPLASKRQIHMRTRTPLAAESPVCPACLWCSARRKPVRRTAAATLALSPPSIRTSALPPPRPASLTLQAVLQLCYAKSVACTVA